VGVGAALVTLERALDALNAADVASVPASAPTTAGNGYSAPEGGREAAEHFAVGLSRGELPSVRQVRREMHLGQPRAQEVRAYLETFTRR
jgi:hypothetical protein